MRVVILAMLAVIVGVPVLGRCSRRNAAGASPGGGGGEATKLVVVTPHIEQIRLEFGEAFAAWHLRVYGSVVEIDWRTPGGTSEIRKLLESQAEAAVAAGAFALVPAKALKNPGGEKPEDPPLMEAVIDPALADLPDVFFGGGSFEHAAVKSGIVTSVTVSGEGGDNPIRKRVRVRISAPPSHDTNKPAPFERAWLDERFGPENRVGVERLYDDDQHWFGTALSGFGIVYNRDILGELGLPEPISFGELGHPSLVGKVALADPRLSGSVATLYDSILNKEGWDKGWRTLREMSSNARYFSSSSTQPPLDVSQGECAVGVAIDFYGRGQSQSLIPQGADPASSRVGYVDPPGATYIDADPASIINGARRPELARRFIEFCLTDEAQALWQFAPLDLSTGPPGDRLGPSHERLRRMPVKPGFYERYLDRFTDKTNAFAIASKTPLRGWRDAIGPLMGAFAIDNRRELQAAWVALNRARADPSFPPVTLAKMEEAFYAMPVTEIEGQMVVLSESTFAATSKATGRWRSPEAGARAKIAYTRFFKERYREVVELAATR